MSENKYAEKAERGAKLLDEKMPGWWANIKTDRLAMGSICDCVLGQQAPDARTTDPYATVARMMGLVPYGDKNTSSKEYGFMSNGSGDDDELKAAWLVEIEKRVLADMDRGL